MDLSQYLGMFLEESREHLQRLNEGLLGLESNPEDSRLINEIFRSAHTLKGMSATMGFNQIAELTHQMENVLQKIRNGEVKVGGGLIDALFRCLDSLETMVETVANGESLEMDLAPLLAGLQDGSGQGSGTSPEGETTPVHNNSKEATPGEPSEIPGVELNEFEKNLVCEAQEHGYHPYHLVITIKPTCIMKSVRAFMVVRRLEELGDIIKTVPSVTDIEDERFEQSFELVLLSAAGEAEIAKAVNGVAELEETKVTLLKCLKGVQTAPTPAEGKVSAPVQGQPCENGPTPGSSPATAKKDPGLPRTQGFKTKAVATIRVDIDRLDKLINLVGELVINKTRLAQIGKTSDNPGLSETVEQMDRVFVDLQNLVMKVRMVPIEQVFNRFPRMVRDLAKDLGKEIELEIEGQETELDRTVIDEIGDPLVHLLRNSVDHGVESPDERERAAKPTTAVVRLTARHEGNNVIIEVSDDGKGIDPQRIKAKALEKGIISPAEAETMDDHTAVNLIFRAGFSTAEQVSDVSGRGVGLDAVRSKIEALSGECRIFTKPGSGTTFRIQLPLTLAIIQALLVKVGAESYAIPLSFIDETTSILPRDIKEVQGQDSMLLRGHILPLLRLDTAVGLPPRTWSPEEELLVVVVRRAGKTLGLLVDELVGQQEVVIKTLGELVGGLPGIGGATILGDGTVSLILDVSTLV